MIFGDIPKYSAKELERLAVDFLKERCKPAISIPIDIDYLAETEPGVILDYTRGLKDRYPVAGVTILHPDGTYGIYIDEGVADHNPNFYRFTVAEELAHIKLHKSILDEVKDINLAFALRSWRGYEKIDRNAKRFAAAILMPSSHVVEDARKYYPKLVAAAGFGNKDAVIQYMISILCKKYIVSYEAMKYRLDEWPIRIIEKIISAIKEELDFLE